MADVIPTEGLENLLDMVLDAPGDKKVRLFKNNLTVVDSTVLGDFVEATYSGYAPLVLAPVRDPDVEVPGVVRSQPIDVEFTHNGGPVSNLIYGYYVTYDLAGVTKFLWGGRFDDGPNTMAAITDVVEYGLEIRETQEV